MGLSSAGIGSGLDVTGIVTQLMAAAQPPLNALTAKQTDYNAKVSAYGTISSGLSNLQSVLATLSDPAKLQTVSATVADSTVLSATGSSSAASGTYSLEVTQLAQAQKLASAGQVSNQAAIGTGVISFDFGTISGGTLSSGKYVGVGGTGSAGYTSNGLGSKSVTIDTGNNSLLGIRDAINAAGIGVTANIVNDGSTSPYRLTLSNSQTGESQSMKISVGGEAPGATGLSVLLGNDPAGVQNLTESVPAQNARFLLDGIAVSKTSNVVTDTVSGVTLSLKKTNVGAPTSLSVARDTSALSSNLGNLVKSYNSLSGSLKSLSSYNMASRKGATLYGESTLRSMQSNMRNILTSALPDSAGSLTRLNQVGISFQKDGTLALDSTKLNAAITTNFKQIATLFAATGVTNDNQVSYTSSTTATKVGSYAVAVSQLASQGRLAGQTVSGLGITAGTNDSLQVTLDNQVATITLSPGTYASAGALATEIQSRINGIKTFADAGSAVTVSADGAGKLSLVSSRYGATSNISLSGTLLSGTGTATAGTQLSGTINGVAALGTGQTLTGAAGNAVEGLKLTITGMPTTASVKANYTQGFAYQLNQLASSFLSDNGIMTVRTTSLNDSLRKVGTNIDNMRTRLATLQAGYQKQYTALDTAMAKMNSTTTFLTQQLASLAKSA